MKSGIAFAVCASLAAALALALLASMALGAVSIAPMQVVRELFAGPLAGHPVLWQLRIPRALLAAIVGAALASSGVAMQGVFRNPLADPGLIAVSSGAALATAFSIVVGVGHVAMLGLFALPAMGFLGALATALLVWRMATAHGRTDVTALLLSGVALNALCGSATGLLTFVANDAQLRSLTFWSLGSLGGASWQTLGIAAPFLLPALLLLPTLASGLDALTLGEAEAEHLGVRVERLRRAALGLCAVAVGASVALCGVIGFIGLVCPHVARRIVGPSHRAVFPTATLLGALVLVVADLIARTAAAPAELPLGVLCAFLGAPFLLSLIRGRLRAAGAL